MNAAVVRRTFVVALAIGAALWLVWMLGLAERGFAEDVDGNVLGVDHSIFHTAGKMVADNRGASLYDLSDFNAALHDVREQPVTNDSPHFLNPPGVAYLFAPLAGLGRTMGWLALGAMGVVALCGAIRFVGMSRPWLAAGLVILTLPGWLTLRLGQLAFLWALLLAGVYWLVRHDRLAAAGLVAGLLALKPQFAAIVAVWWLLDAVKYRRALGWLLVSGGTITALTFSITPGSIGGFTDAALGAVQDAKFPIGYSLNDTVLGLAPSLPDLAVAAVVAGLGVAALAVVVRRFPGDLAVQFAAVTFAAVWIPPHLIAYDWVLLWIGVTALWASRPAQRPEWLFVGSVLAIWAAFAWLFAQAARELWGVRLELAAVGLAVIVLWAYRRLLIGSADPVAVDARKLPLNV